MTPDNSEPLLIAGPLPKTAYTDLNEHAQDLAKVLRIPYDTISVIKGAKGDTGERGLKGNAGPPGPMGPTGPTPGSVVLRRQDQDAVYFKPLLNTNVARYIALRAALVSATSTPLIPSIVELEVGDFAVPVNTPLTTHATAGNVTIIFKTGASLIYADPEDACDDYTLFTGPRNVRNFGAELRLSGGAIPTIGSSGDSQKAFQTAFNSLGTLYPEPSPILLQSGRILRTGQVYVPNGQYFFGGKVFYSPTVEIVGESTNGTQCFLLDGVFNSLSVVTEHFVFTCDPPVSANINDLFYTQVRNMSIACLNPSLNIRASGLSILGGQGTQVANAIVIDFSYRNIYGIGCSLIDVWAPDCVRGPSVHLLGGGFIRGGSFEHTNAAGVNNPDIPGTVYPAVLLESGVFEVDGIIGEEVGGNSQTVVHCHNVISADFGVIGMGVAPSTTRTHTLLRITGTSQNVSVRELFGFYNGYFPIDIGTLVNDTSDFSPNGAGVPYTLTDIRGTYSQKYGGFVPGLDRNNIFTGNNLFGNPANFTDGITVRSSIGDIVLAGGGYSTGRSTSYFNFNVPVPHDWNNGAMTLTTSGILNVTGEYRVDGIKVIGNQGAAIADATDAASAITQLNALLASLRSGTGHGLIAT